MISIYEDSLTSSKPRAYTGDFGRSPRLANTLRAGYVLKRIAHGACSCGYN